MKWQPSDSQERRGVAIIDQAVSELGQIFREQDTNDVGIDAHIELVDATHHATGQLVGLQIKSGRSFLKETDETGFIFRGNDDHLNYWLNHCLPVFLMLVDSENGRVFWQEINPETIESTGKGWKVTVPFEHELNADFLTKVSFRVGLKANSSSYTFLSLSDTSNGLVKRYAATILLRAPFNRMRIEAIARRATLDIKRQTYLKGGDTMRELLNREADVVSLYMATDPNDVENANWIARTLWINNQLPTGSRPLKIGGDALGEGLEIVWHADYSIDANFYKALQIDKGDFLSQVDQNLEETKTLMDAVFASSGISPSDKIAKSELEDYAQTMRSYYLHSGNIGLPPLDCKDVAARFHDIMALADNAFILACQDISGGSDRMLNAYVLETTLKDYRANLGWVLYELEKIR